MRAKYRLKSPAALEINQNRIMLLLITFLLMRKMSQRRDRATQKLAPQAVKKRIQMKGYSLEIG